MAHAKRTDPVDIMLQSRAFSSSMNTCVNVALFTVAVFLKIIKKNVKKSLSLIPATAITIFESYLP